MFSPIVSWPLTQPGERAVGVELRAELVDCGPGTWSRSSSVHQLR